VLLASHLVDQGIAFNGLVLVSCALDFQGFVFSTRQTHGLWLCAPKSFERSGVLSARNFIGMASRSSSAENSIAIVW